VLAHGVRTAGTGTLATSGLDDRADCKVVFLVCENRMSSVRFADIAWPRVMGAARLAGSNASFQTPTIENRKLTGRNGEMWTNPGSFFIRAPFY
jgi:hypothetical protein